MGKWSKYERRYSADWEKESDFKDWIQKTATDSTKLSCVFALIRFPFVIHAIIFGLFLATFCDHFLANFPAPGNPGLGVGTAPLCKRLIRLVLHSTGTGDNRESDNDNEKSYKYVCITTNQPDTKANAGPNPNPALPYY